jgi:hypothetical protein
MQAIPLKWALVAGVCLLVFAVYSLTGQEQIAETEFESTTVPKEGKKSAKVRRVSYISPFLAPIYDAVFVFIT